MPGPSTDVPLCKTVVQIKVHLSKTSSNSVEAKKKCIEIATNTGDHIGINKT